MAGTAIVVVGIFYGVMYFFPEVIGLPYDRIPAFLKLDRMIAAEAIECSIASDGGIESGALFGMFMSEAAGINNPSRIVIVGLTKITTRTEIIEIRDDACG